MSSASPTTAPTEAGGTEPAASGADGGAKPLSGATAMSLGGQTGCAVVSGGTVQCWGSDMFGAAGFSSPLPVTIAGLSGATEISVSGDPEGTACAVLSGGTVQCWGDNTYGELGNGTLTNSTTPVSVAGLTGAIAVSVGASSACAMLTGGTVQCWGSNAEGELGNGTMTSSTTPVSVAGLAGVTGISVTGGTACAVLTGGTVECWGDNTYGVLGNGTSTGPDTCAASGLACSTTPVSVAGVTGAIAVSVGDVSACALLTGGTVQCWGLNDDGELGNGTSTAPDMCTGSPCSTPVAVTGLTGAIAISVGFHSACALLGAGTVQCWGANALGMLGNGTSTGPEMCGDDPCSTTPVSVASLTGAIAISVSDLAACALVAGGTVQCWGAGQMGELGNGTMEGSLTPVTVQ